MSPQTITNVPAVCNLVAYRSDDFSINVTVKDDTGNPVDVGGTWAAQVRPSAESTTVLGAFTIDGTNAASGQLVLDLDTTTFPDTFSLAVWDLQWTDSGGIVMTLLAGSFKLVPDVTQ
jgi:hypothetical protein